MTSLDTQSDMQLSRTGWTGQVSNRMTFPDHCPHLFFLLHFTQNYHAMSMIFNSICIYFHYYMIIYEVMLL